MSKSSKDNRHCKATEFKVEYWTEVSGQPRRHRSRYYSTLEGMLRAGARWEARGTDYFCEYHHGFKRWQSSTRTKITDTQAPVRRVGRPSPRRDRVEIYSVFGQIEAAAAEIMIEKGKIRRIPKEEIPESALYNEHGAVALFAIMVERQYQTEFDNLCRSLRQ